MNYGLYYKEVNFNSTNCHCQKSNFTRSGLEEGELHSSHRSTRSSEVAWVRDMNLLSMLMRMSKQINRSAHWNLNLSGIEPVQFGVYGEGDFYDWHVDQHPKPVNGFVRKISMTLFLNDDYEGGDLIWRYIDQMQIQGTKLLS